MRTNIKYIFIIKNKILTVITSYSIHYTKLYDNGMFYITRLMDMNFTKLRNSKDIVLMFRKNKTDSWQEIDSEYKRDYIEAELKNGDYAFAIKTK